MSQQSQPTTLSPSSIEEESPPHESDNDNNTFGSLQNYENDDILLEGDIFGHNFDFNDVWNPPQEEEDFTFEPPQRESPQREVLSPTLFLPQPPASLHQLLPSNQIARNTPRPAPSNEQPPIAHNAFRFPDSDPFAEYLDFTPPPPSATPQSSRAAASGRTTRLSSVVDLTGSPPAEMAPATRDRKRKERDREPDSTSEERPNKLARLVNKELGPPTQKSEDADVIDLVDIEDGLQYQDFQAKQQAEAIKQQNLDEATRPVKLAEFQCIICMDNPTDLTVTHCGRSIYNDLLT